MEVTQVYLNNRLVTVQAEPKIIQKLNTDDRFLSDYINQAVRLGQFDFLFKGQDLKRVLVKRAPNLKQVWLTPNANSETDVAATELLLKLRRSNKYSSRFVKSTQRKTTIWNQLADEMIAAGYAVDGDKCSHRYFEITTAYIKYCATKGPSKPPFFDEIKAIIEGESQPNQSMKRPHDDDSDDDDTVAQLLNKYLKRNRDDRDRFDEITKLFKERTDLMRQKLKQNERIIDLLEKIANT